MRVPTLASTLFGPSFFPFWRRSIFPSAHFSALGAFLGSWHPPKTVRARRAVHPARRPWLAWMSHNADESCGADRRMRSPGLQVCHAGHAGLYDSPMKRA